jgi:hypothetical protein
VKHPIADDIIVRLCCNVTFYSFCCALVYPIRHFQAGSKSGGGGGGGGEDNCQLANMIFFTRN